MRADRTRDGADIFTLFVEEDLIEFIFVFDSRRLDEQADLYGVKISRIGGDIAVSVQIDQIERFDIGGNGLPGIGWIQGITREDIPLQGILISIEPIGDLFVIGRFHGAVRVTFTNYGKPDSIFLLDIVDRRATKNRIVVVEICYKTEVIRICWIKSGRT